MDSDVLTVPESLVAAIGYIKASNSDGTNDPQVFSDELGDAFGRVVSLSGDGNTLAVGAQFEDSSATGINGNQNDNRANAAGAVYLFGRINGVWQQQAYLKASNAEAEDTFGSAVSLSADGNTVVVGASMEDSASAIIGGTQSNNDSLLSGAAYVFTRNAQSWQQQAYIKANSVSVGDGFGAAVGLSADGNTMVIGAAGEDSSATGINGNQSDNSANNSGAAYVFTRSNNVWQQQAYLKASNTDNADRFGMSVSLSADGNRLAVAANGEDSASRGINGNENNDNASGSGAVYVFSRIGETWQQQSYIKASNADRSDRFGISLSLSADGQSLAVGAPSEDGADVGINGRENDNSLGNSGAVYVFSFVDGSWQQQAYVKASNTAVADAFGGAVSLSGDGTLLVVGAVREASSATGLNGNESDNFAPSAGAAYLFVNSNGTWQQQSFIKASNAEANDEFGFALSISDDGNTLAVGAQLESSATNGINGDQGDNTAVGAGAVYLY